MPSPSRIAAVYRYPVKGLSAEPLTAAALAAGGALPFDRAFAVENGPSGFDAAAPKFLPKAHFLMLMRNERLAALDTRFDDATMTLTIRRDGAVAAEGRLDTDAGKRTIEAFFDAYAAGELRGPARVLAAPGHSFSDAGTNLVSLINLASVEALAAALGVPVHPLRFRGNLYVAGLPAWAEFDWVGRQVVSGDVTFEVSERINRCAATNVNPETAARDLAIPRALLDLYGHDHCGIYMKVIAGGELKPGAEIHPL